MIINRPKAKPHVSAVPDQSPIVFVIDDNPDVREALKSLLESVRLDTRVFASTEEFLRNRVEAVSCLVLDVRLSGTSGLDFQTRLADAGIDIPIIFITGHGDIRMSVRAMKAGAVQFLTKPFREQDLLDAVREALERDRARRNRVGQSQALKSRYESLSEREREILPLVTTGLQNKQIAHQVQLSEVTVKVHRANLMRKLQVRGLTALVKAAGALGVS